MHWLFCGAVIGCVQNVASLYWTWDRGVSNGPKSIHQQYPPKVLLTKLKISILGSWSHTTETRERNSIRVHYRYRNNRLDSWTALPHYSKAYWYHMKTLQTQKLKLLCIIDPSVWASRFDHCLKLVWTLEQCYSHTPKNSSAFRLLFLSGYPLSPIITSLRKKV